ncbi:DHH family phosphoesterase [Acetonema longum]|uniref:Phosphoesterase RecJ domain protein n=1 Tax=Acetonema longum DSM 6540 TaxID=1009370 RepID=F7NL96_9FIRM|nr:bifunctional oligoribonuclease/PAP phosphatase NrnA [Acetonema longum]EGO63201.1 phosphoesterase RecJ domain protein [Acetonema longum DSM 6540]
MKVSLDQAHNLIRSADQILITGHIHPDGDCLGSMLGLYHHLKAAGKKATLLLDDDVPSGFRFLPNWTDIKKPAHQNEQYITDLLIVLDASDKERIGRVGACVSGPVLNLDHHVSNTQFADYWYVDTKAAATGEIIVDLIHAAGEPIDPDSALCLYTAIATDCGFFRYANTTPKVLRYAADLLEQKVKPELVSESIETSTLADIQSLIAVLGTLELQQEGRAALITVDSHALSLTENTESYINYPRSIAGVEVAVMLKEVEADCVRVSLRSKTADVSKIALSFGGGGHMRAAGCTLNTTLDQAKSRILEAIARGLAER